MRSMTYEEYKQLEGLTSSQIADFANWQQNIPPAITAVDALRRGQRFEECIRMKFDKNYTETFCVLPDGPSTPDDFLEIIDLIKDGTPLAHFYKYTQKGDLNKTYKARHWWLDKIKAGEVDIDKPFIQYEDQLRIDNAVEKLIRMPIDLLNITVEELLSDGYWSVPIQWEEDGILKKGLIDFIGNFDGTLQHVDFKSTANKSNFYNHLYSRYRYQERHYTHGMRSFIKKRQPLTMIFLVGVLEPPHLPFSQHLDLNEKMTTYADNQYAVSCLRCQAWINQGRPESGYLEQKPYTWR